MLGRAAHDVGSDRAFNRHTGAGRITAKDGDYTDALSKKRKVVLLVTETTGALSKMLVRLLRALERTTMLPDGNDSTVYGTGRASPRSFYAHHAAAISASIVKQDSCVLRNAQAQMSFSLLMGGV